MNNGQKRLKWCVLVAIGHIIGKYRLIQITFTNSDYQMFYHTDTIPIQIIILTHTDTDTDYTVTDMVNINADYLISAK